MTALAIPQAGGLVIEAGNPEFEATCAHMAREFAAACAEIRRHAAGLRAQCDRLHAAFKGEMGDRTELNPFEIHLSHDAYRSWRCDVEEILGAMKRRAWRMLFDRIGVKKVMSVKKRKEFEERLERGELPDIDEETIVGVILGMADQLQDFAAEAAREVFEYLRPWRKDYKTNNAFRVGRKVILSLCVERGWGGSKFRVTHFKEPQLIATDGVFHLLDGRGVMADRKGPLVEAIETCPGGRGETEFFKFKCFKNGNLHLEFKRLDLVKQLNLLGAGEHVLGAEGEGT